MANRGIKIDPRFKGKWHYEEYLISKFRKEIVRYILEMGYEQELRSLIKRLYDINVVKENVIRLYSHSLNEVVHHLCYGTLDKLMNNTTARA